MRNVCVAGDYSNGSNSILIRRCVKKRSVETSNYYRTNSHSFGALGFMLDLTFSKNYP